MLGTAVVIESSRLGEGSLLVSRMGLVCLATKLVGAGSFLTAGSRGHAMPDDHWAPRRRDVPVAEVCAGGCELSVAGQNLVTYWGRAWERPTADSTDDKTLSHNLSFVFFSQI